MAVSAAACRESGPGAVAARADSAAGRFLASYGPATPEFAEFRDRLIANRFLDSIAERLNDSLVIPRDLALVTGHCAEPNASYDPPSGRVTLCYELFQSLSHLFANQAGAEYLVAGTVVFALMHELAHALIDVLDLPVTGREEDAADQLAILLLLEQGAVGDSLAFGAVGWLASNAQSIPPNDLTLAGEHGLELQRVYNLVCWIYGRDSTRYPELASDEWLPEFRRRRCPSEFARLERSWSTLLAPHRKAG
jgi:hypothetical protein